MSATKEPEVQDLDPVELVTNEIELSRKEHRPVSRQLLADLVFTKTGMRMDQAWLLVDAYCDEHEAAIPGYLSLEFNMHWPKVVGVLLAVAAIVVAWMGVQATQAKWAYFCGATLIWG